MILSSNVPIVFDICGNQAQPKSVLQNHIDLELILTNAPITANQPLQRVSAVIHDTDMRDVVN